MAMFESKSFPSYNNAEHLVGVLHIMSFKLMYCKLLLSRLISDVDDESLVQTEEILGILSERGLWIITSSISVSIVNNNIDNMIIISHVTTLD